MKPLPKHPKQQRMEDMTFPITKMGKRMNRIIAKAFNKKHVDTSEKGSELTLDKLEAIEKDMRKVFKKDMTDKVVWEGREWLRSINDDMGFTLLSRMAWRMVAVGVLVVAVIYCVTIALCT